MCEPEDTSYIKADADHVAVRAWAWFNTYGEWPTPSELHHHLAAHVGYPVEHAEHDVLAALNAGEVTGVHSVVLMRHGEALGDWRDPLPGHDSGFRIVMSDANRRIAERSTGALSRSRVA